MVFRLSPHRTFDCRESEYLPIRGEAAQNIAIIIATSRHPWETLKS
jgi:hypothetical protein